MISLFKTLNKDKAIGQASVKEVLETLSDFLKDDCSAGSQNLILLQKSQEKDGLTPLELRIQFTVSAIRLHPGNVQVQLTACKCLSNFAISAEIVSQLMAAGALPLVLGALERFWWDADLQRAACSAMWNIARNNEARAQLGVKAAKTIFKTLELHKGSDFVQEAALGSLANLAPNNDVQNHLCTKEKLHVIFLSMYTHAGCDLLQTAACGLLNNLAHGDKHALTIGQMGGIRLIVTAMRRHNHNGKLLRNACAALANLSTESKNFKKLLRAKALEALMWAYHLCPDDVPALKDMARAALQNMGVRDLAFQTSSIHLAALNARGSLDAILPMMAGKHTALYGDARQFTFEENEDMNARDSELNTPLHLAIERRDLKLAKILIARGADLTLKNKDEQTALTFIEKAIEEDEKKKADNGGVLELKSDDDPDVQIASGEELREAVVEGKRQFKILKGVFADLLSKVVPEVPHDVAFLLADFAHMSDFVKYVDTSVAFDSTEKSWTSFRKFLNRKDYTAETPTQIERMHQAQLAGLDLQLSAPQQRQNHRTISPFPPGPPPSTHSPGYFSSGSSADVNPFKNAGAGASMPPTQGSEQSMPSGWRESWFDRHEQEQKESASSSSAGGFRQHKPPALSISGLPGGDASRGSLSQHCRRMSQQHPGLQPLYTDMFGDGVIDLTEDDSDGDGDDNGDVGREAKTEDGDGDGDGMSDAQAEGTRRLSGAKRNRLPSARSTARFPRKAARQSLSVLSEDGGGEDEISDFEQWLDMQPSEEDRQI